MQHEMQVKEELLAKYITPQNVPLQEKMTTFVLFARIQKKELMDISSSAAST